MKNDILSTVAALSDADLVARVKGLSVRERETTAQLVAHIAILEKRDVYLREGYPSIFVYCRDALGLSEGEAYNRIEVARAARRFPVILEMLSGGEIYLWSVRRLAPHLTLENHLEVLQSARGKKSKLTIQEIVARLAPRPDVPTTIWKVPAPPPAPVAPPAEDEPTPVLAPGVRSVLPENGLLPSVRPAVVTPAAVTPLSPDRYKIQLTIGGDTLDKLRLAQDMLSHAVPSGDDAAVLDRALSALLMELAKRKFAQTRRRRSRGPKDDSDISAAVKCVVYVRDRGRCTFVGAHGHRCEERRYVQFHHIDARARGGKATPDKITLRCRAHNDYEGRLLFGKRRRNDGVGVVREDRPAYGSWLHGRSNSFQNECATVALRRPERIKTPSVGPAEPVKKGGGGHPSASVRPSWTGLG